MFEGLTALEGIVLPSTPPSVGEEAWRGPPSRHSQSGGAPPTASGSPQASPQRHARRSTQHSASQLTARNSVNQVPAVSAADASVRSSNADGFIHQHPAGSGPLLAPGGPTLAFFLQLTPPPPHSIVTAVLPSSLKPYGSERMVLKLPPAPAGPPSGARCSDTPAGALSPVVAAGHPTGSSQAGADPSQPVLDPRSLRHAVLLLSFSTPAATHAALAKLHAAALASNGGAALAALQPVPLVARLFSDAAAANDAAGAERCAEVLLALLAVAQLPLPDDVAAALVVPAAVTLLGGSAARATAADAAVNAAAAAAVAGGTLSSSGLHLRLQPYQACRAAAAGLAAPAVPSSQPAFQHLLPSSPHPHHYRTCSSAASAHAPEPPSSCRVAAARLLLHLATGSSNPAAAASATASGLGPGPGLGAARDRLVSAGALEACAAALRDSVAADPELQLATLRLLAALTADVSGWPWEWPVVRAAAVEGCARHTVALLQLLGPADWGAGGAPPTEESLSHAAAREVVAALSRGPLLVREVLLRAGVMAPLVEAIMLWPPPGPPSLGASSGPGAGGRRRSSVVGAVPPTTPCAGVDGPSAGLQHFCLCLGVLLNLSSLPRVRALLSSPAMVPLVAHLVGLLEQPHALHEGPGGPASPGVGPDSAAGEAAHQQARRCSVTGALSPLHGEPQAGTAPASVGGASGTLLELLLNLALDPACHPALTAAGAPHVLVRCIAAAATPQLLRLVPASAGAARGGSAAADFAPQPWRSAAALRLVAALAADSRYSMPRPAMQAELIAAGALEAVVEEVQRTAAAVSGRSGAAAAPGPAPAAASAYERSLGALCALMTGNGGVQRAVATEAELLSALAAALAAPAVMRSDGRLRITLAAWRLITAPLAAQGADADATTAINLLVGLGQDPAFLPTVRTGSDGRAFLHGSASTLYDAAAEQGAPQLRQSVLQGAVAAAAAAAAAGAGAAGPGRPSSHRRSSDTEHRFDRITETDLEGECGSGGPSPRGPASAGSNRAPVPLWTGPLLPGTALPPPSGLPPELAPLRAPSCVRSPSRVGSPRAAAGPSREGLGPQRGMDRGPSGATAPLALTAAAATEEEIPSGSSLAARSGATIGSPALKPVATQQPPHRSVFVSPVSDDEGDQAGAGAASPVGNGSRASSIRAAPLRPFANSSSPPSQPPAPIAAAADLPPLPGELPARVGGSPQPQPHAQAQPTHHPHAAEAGGGHSSRGSGSASSRLRRESFDDAGDTARDGSAKAGAPAALISPVRSSEMAPPLQCLVTHLQALLARPGCRAGAALVLVQLARLGVVRGSAAMAAGWGPLMEAITSSLTGGAAAPGMGPPSTRREPPRLQPPSRGSGGSRMGGRRSSSSGGGGVLNADPRDQLALLEAMHVAAAAGSSAAAEGRAALTHGSVVTALADLACGRGALAESLQHASGQQGSHTVQGGQAHHHHHHHHPQQQQHAAPQNFLLRARSLAIAVLGELVPQQHVAAQLQEAPPVTLLLVSELLRQLSTAVAAADAPPPPQARVPAAAASAASASASAGSPDELAARLRHGTARLLRALAGHVVCAREALALPGSVGVLVAAMAALWDTHGPTLAPATAAAAALPRATFGAYASLGLPRPAARLLDTGTSLTSGTSGSLLGSSRRPATGPGLGTPLPPGTAGGAPAAALAPALALVNMNSMRRSLTGPQGLPTAARPSGSGMQPSALSRPAGTLAAMMAAPEQPHGVATRMSLAAAAGPEATQWTAPAKHALKALELSEEANAQAPLPSRHAHTHAGMIGMRPHPPGAAPLLPPQASHPVPLQQPARRSLSRQGTSQLGRSPLPLLGPGLPAAAALAPNPDSAAAAAAVGVSVGVAGGAKGPNRPAGGGVDKAGPVDVVFDSEDDAGGEADGGGGEGGVGDAVMSLGPVGRTVARRGTRALAPPQPAGGVLPPSGDGSGRRLPPRAAAAAACAAGLAETLALLAGADTDAARTMSTLPAMELFVDLLSAAWAPLVLAALGLLQRLAARQDAHETFWDCDAVAALVSHLQLRSPAAAAALAAAPATSAAGGASEAAAGAARDGAAGCGTAAALQLRSAQVLERLAADPDLHGRLAATELPAALVAVVRRAALPGPGAGAGPQLGGSAGWPPAAATPLPAAGSLPGAAPAACSPPPVSTSLLVCVLSALSSLLDCEDVRRQARERRLSLYLGALAGGASDGGGEGDAGFDSLVVDLAAQCGEKLMAAPRPRTSAGGRLHASRSTPLPGTG